MAKGNLFLGTGSRKLGDVVLYRREGIQQARVRVRKIANPQTDAQALQRNYLAPVARFYAPLSGVLERSWEGLNKSKSYQAFLKKNIDKARSAGWYLPKGTEFFPLPYQVSKGTLPSLGGSHLNNNNVSIPVSGLLETMTTLGALSQQLIESGYEEGDQLTILAIVSTPNGYVPSFTRMFLSSQDGTALSNFNTSYFEIVAAAGALHISLGNNGDSLVAGCAIMSRYSDGKWLRSSESLLVASSVLDTVTGLTARDAAIASYQKGSSLISSDVYLNGSTPSVSSDNTLFVTLYDNSGQIILTDGQITPLSLEQDGLTINGREEHVVYVVGKRASNGARVRALIRSVVPGSASNGRYLSDMDGSATQEEIPRPFYYVQLTGSNNEFADFLNAYGVDVSAFVSSAG